MNLLGKNKLGGLIVNILISYLIFIVLIYHFNHDNPDRLTSFLIVFFAALTALYFLGMGGVSRYGFNIRKYFIIGFLVKTVIGLVFWEFYIFPNYFSLTISQMHFDHFEFLITNLRMQEFAEYRIANGIFSYPISVIVGKNGFIHYVMSNMYLSGSFHPLDLSVQNSLFSIFTSLIVTHIVKSEGGSAKQIKYALLLSIFQPFSFISTIIWRDVFGQFFVALGGYLLYRAMRVNKISMLVLVVLASLSMFLQRYIYTFYPFITLVVYLLFQKKNRLKVLLLLPLLGFVLNYFDNLLSLSSHLVEGYGGNISGIELWIYLPFNIVRLLVGPFPWTNWFEFNDNSIFLIADYFQAVMNITLISLFVNVILKKKYFLKVKSIFSVLRPVDVLFLILFSLFVFAGLGTEDVHLVYMSTGAIFLIPTISLANTGKNFKSTYLIVLLLFIVFNVLFLGLGLGGQGLGSSFR